MMVDDDDVALGGATSHLGYEAAVVLRTFLPCAAFGASVQLRPQLAGFGQDFEFGAIPSLRLFFPIRYRPILIDLIEPIENRLIREVIKFLAAEIVIAALHVTDTQRGIDPRSARGR